MHRYKILTVTLCFPVQIINYSHLFPTRYALELEGLKNILSADTFNEPSQRKDAKENVKKLFKERYLTGKNRWFFTPLRVSVHRACLAELDDDVVLSTLLSLRAIQNMSYALPILLYTSHRPSLGPYRLISL